MWKEGLGLAALQAAVSVAAYPLESLKIHAQYGGDVEALSIRASIGDVYYTGMHVVVGMRTLVSALRFGARVAVIGAVHDAAAGGGGGGGVAQIESIPSADGELGGSLAESATRAGSSQEPLATPVASAGLLARLAGTLTVYATDLVLESLLMLPATAIRTAEVVNLHASLPERRDDMTPLIAMRSIVESRGPAALWAGIDAVLARTAIDLIVQDFAMGVAQAALRGLPIRRSTANGRSALTLFEQAFVVNPVAVVAGAVASHPWDVLVTRAQTGDGGDSVRSLYEESPLREGLFAGLGYRVSHRVISQLAMGFFYVLFTPVESR